MQTHHGHSSSAKYNAVVMQDGGWWIGWVEEIPGVNCQESTKEKLLSSLAVTLQEALEMNRNEAVALAHQASTNGLFEEHAIAL